MTDLGRTQDLKRFTRRRSKLALLKITAYGDPLLRKQAAKVKTIDEDLKDLAEDMLETMHSATGIGLAAPQVGVSKMFFIVDWSQLSDDDDPKSDDGFQVYINPTVQKVNGNVTGLDEGCLSLPEVTAEVPRADHIEFTYQNLEGEEVTEELDGYPARVFQHEYDHLLGILFIDRIAASERKKVQGTLQDILSGKIKAFDGTKDNSK
ncbi:MAG: peptide deformylase [Calditrichaeota bacterium]|nr:peptide deformylase [Calditrichota bacterium]